MADNLPRAIDTKLAAIYAPAAEIMRKLEHARANLTAMHVRKDPARVADFNSRINELTEALDALDAAAAPYEAIYAETRWTRFFLVPDGHLHRSRRCSSLRWKTLTVWLPEYSGKNETEIVELAGEAACTICYPSAPVNRLSMLPVHVAARHTAAVESAEKAAKKAKTTAQTITVGNTTYKTTRAAENEIGLRVDYMIGSRYMVAVDASHRAQLDNNAAEDEAAARAIAEALAAQIEGYDAAAILTKKFAAKLKTYKNIEHYNIPTNATF